MEKVIEYNRTYYVVYRIEPKLNDEYKVIASKKLQKPTNQRLWFSTEKKAISDYCKHYKEAMRQYNKLLKLFTDIRKKDGINFHFGYTYEGDTYGIYEEYSYIEITVGDYEFRFTQ